MTRLNSLVGILFCMTAAGFMSMSCVDNMDDESYLGSLSVTVEAPEAYPDMELSGLTVSILSTADGVQSTQTTDDKGTALFEELTAGTYNISVSGTYEGTSINGVDNGVLVESQVTAYSTVSLMATTVDLDSPYYGLIIKEVFYSGHSYNYDVAGATAVKDYFFELYNNGDKAIYLDGIHVAEAWSPVTSDDIANAPAISLREDPNLDHNYVYVSSVIRVPGSGQEHVLNPGESFLVATNAINFKEEVRTAAAEYGLPVDQTMIDHIIDLSTADMETYMRDWLYDQGRVGNEYFDLDNPDVPNMDNVYIADPYDYFYLDMTGSTLIVFKPEEELTDKDVMIYSYVGGEETKEQALMKIPVDCIIDGADFVNNMESARWKRLPDVVDIGFGYIPNDDGSCTNFSQRRKVDAEASAKAGRTIFYDTNNTTNDFEPIDPPTPKGGFNY